MDSIPSPQTILTMHDKLTMAMLPASVKNSQDYDSRHFLFWCTLIIKLGNFRQIVDFSILSNLSICFHLKIISDFRYNVIFSNRATSATTAIPTGWFHLVLNFYGPSSEDWFDIYHNGVDMEVDVTLSSPNNFSAGQGVMVIGRYYAFTDRRYSSVIVDEMILFNRKLTLDEIQILYRINA